MMLPKRKHILILLTITGLLILTGFHPLWADDGRAAVEQDDTMLMFVGEDVGALSIASRREESAWQAPAIAEVITRRQLQDRGVTTLSQALSMQSGFYMAQREWGDEMYLRGIPDSVLLLYDTVPLNSDTIKSLQPTGYELSLESVERIEIIRGPGSVLWGPDAFAGIINVVPMTGKNLNGAETGFVYGDSDVPDGGYVNLGHDAGSWDGFLSISGRKGREDDRSCNLVSFWGDGGDQPVEPEARFGHENPGRSRYFELSGNFSLRDWMTVSGRVSEYKKPYSISENDPDLIWCESRKVKSGFLKFEAKKELDRASAIRFTGYYDWLRPEFEIIDRSDEQKQSTTYGEAIYDRSFLTGSALFTGGFSFRKRYIDDAPIWDSYLPDFLGPDNEDFLPSITKEDYNSRLWSVFGQYSHKIGDYDFWLGGRFDDYDRYEDRFSYSAGGSWTPSSAWMVKLLLGTAYRTPFAQQLREESKPDPEKISTLSAQVAWKPSRFGQLSVTGFLSRLKDHVKEDPYAGLSQTNDQDIKGLEIEGTLSPTPELDFSANLSLLNNDGSKESYRFIESIFVRPDGTVVPIYGQQNYPYDLGPDTLFNLMGTWRPAEWLSGFARLYYVSSRQLIYPRATEFPSSTDVWLMDMSATVRDVIWQNLDVQVAVRNVFDKDYDTPGVYSTIEGDPMTVEVMVRKSW